MGEKKKMKRPPKQLFAAVHVDGAIAHSAERRKCVKAWIDSDVQAGDPPLRIVGPYVLAERSREK